MEYQITFADCTENDCRYNGRDFTYCKEDWKTYKTLPGLHRAMAKLEDMSTWEHGEYYGRVFQRLEFPDKQDIERINNEVYAAGLDSISRYLHSEKFHVDSSVNVNDIIMRICEIKGQLS